MLKHNIRNTEELAWQQATAACIKYFCTPVHQPSPIYSHRRKHLHADLIQKLTQSMHALNSVATPIHEKNKQPHRVNDFHKLSVTRREVIMRSVTSRKHNVYKPLSTFDAESIWSQTNLCLLCEASICWRSFVCLSPEGWGEWMALNRRRWLTVSTPPFIYGGPWGTTLNRLSQINFSEAGKLFKSELKVYSRVYWNTSVFAVVTGTSK